MRFCFIERKHTATEYFRYKLDWALGFFFNILKTIVYSHCKYMKLVNLLQ